MRYRNFINGLIKLLARILLLRIEITGMENVPAAGPLIIMINHVNFVDAPLALALVPRDKVGMTKIETFENPILGPLARWYGIFGVRRGEVDRKALRQAVGVLQSGMALLYSPEGHRSGHGRLQRGKGGIAYIASRTHAAIIPVAISGGETFKANFKRLRHTRIQFVVGRAFRFCAELENARNPQMTQMAAQAMYQLAQLLPERYRGEYRDLSQASTNHLEFLTAAG